MDMQTLQRHIMFKQLQELQRRQQLQDLGNSRQQNYINPINRQAGGGQFPSLINGTPIHDPQMFMVGNTNLAQREGSPAVQGVPNGVSYPQAQQFDMSLYGTPIASARNNLSQYPHMQGISNKASENQAEKLIIQSSAFGNFFPGDNCNVSSNQHPDEAFISKQVLQGRNLLGQIPVQGLNSGVLSEDFQQVHTLQRNGSPQDFSGRQERAGWPGLFPGKSTQVKPSQGLATLDPLEEKILFNVDDNNWNASFGDLRDSGNTLESTDCLNSFPSIQSGSWSALMQSAVAEASSSDTGLQEEWSGLSFQNTELSPDNHPSNFFDSGKQQTGFGTAMQSVSSLSSKSQLLFSDSNTSSVFPGFQQSSVQFPINQRKGLCSDSSHESDFFFSNPREKQSIEKSQPVQTHSPLENGWRGQNHEQSETDTHQRVISSYSSEGQLFRSLIGGKAESPLPSGSLVPSVCHTEIFLSNSRSENSDQAKYMEKGPDSRHWKNENITGANLFSNSTDGLEQLKFGADNKIVDREDSQSNIFAASPRSTMSKVDEIGGHDLSDNLWLHNSNSRPVAEGSKQSYGQVGQKAYHPMGNMGLNMENADTTEHFMHSRVINQQLSQGASSQEQGYLGQFKLMGNISKGPTNLEKGSFVDVQRYSKALEEVPPRGNIGANLSASSNGSVGFYGPNENVQPSQNILQLLHKVDHDSQNNNIIRFGSTESIPQLEVPVAEGPEASVSQQYNHSSASQHTGLRLAPPSQRLPNPNNVFSSPSSPKTGNSTAISSSDPPYSRNGMSQQVGFSIKPPGVWKNVSTQPHPPSTEPHKLQPNVLLSSDSTNNNLETSSSIPNEPHNQNSYGGGTTSVEFGANSRVFDRGEEQLGKESSQQQISADTLDPEANSIGSSSFMAHPQRQDFDRSQPGGNQASAVSRSDLEAFGRSLRPSHVLHQIYSKKHAETKSSDLNSQQETSVAGHNLIYGHNSGVKNPVKNQLNALSRFPSFPSTDSKMLSFSSDVREDQSVKDSSQPLYQDTPKEMVMVGQSCTQSQPTNSDAAPNVSEHSQIRLQMSPSWFKNYGILRNGQMLPMYDAMAAKNAAQQFPHGMPFENFHKSASILNAGKQSDAYVLPSVIADQNLAIVRPKKRKFSVYKLLAWHKEVEKGSWRPETISMAELEWARATNRLIEKVENKAEITEYGQPVLRPKKRLILTTQLTKQVFRPPPASTLSVDASSDHDSVAYFVARLALGDACSLTSCSSSDSLISEEPKIPERLGKQYFSKIAEDFTRQAKKLEKDFSRVEKTISILDTRVEIQELEKFSIINRFAKFHSRGQADTSGTSPSISNSPTVLRAFPQRYVTALPMPRTVPEGPQCLSL